MNFPSRFQLNHGSQHNFYHQLDDKILCCWFCTKNRLKFLLAVMVAIFVLFYLFAANPINTQHVDKNYRIDCEPGRNQDHSYCTSIGCIEEADESGVSLDEWVNGQLQLANEANNQCTHWPVSNSRFAHFSRAVSCCMLFFAFSRSIVVHLCFFL